MNSRTEEEKEFNIGRYKAAKKVAKKAVAVPMIGISKVGDQGR